MSAINITYYNTANSIDLEVIGTITMTFNHDIGSGGGIEEAPIDGKQYARKDADWEEVAASGEVNVIEVVQQNGVDLTPDLNRKVNVVVPTQASDIGAQNKTLYFSNKSVLTTDFVADTTYAGYGYKAVVTCTGVTSTMLSEVTFSTVEADSGNYARVCLSGTNTVTIYAKAVPLTDITIPTIKSETV